MLKSGHGSAKGPNIKEGGIAFGTDCVAAGEVTAATVDGSDKPVWVKLSPNVADIASMGVACEENGAAAELGKAAPPIAVDCRNMQRGAAATRGSP